MPGLASTTIRTENCAGLISNDASFRLISLNTQSCARRIREPRSCDRSPRTMGLRFRGASSPDSFRGGDFGDLARPLARAGSAAGLRTRGRFGSIGEFLSCELLAPLIVTPEAFERWHSNGRA